MSETPHLQLPLLLASQAQKHVTHNEAIALIDAFTQLAVISRTIAAPPSGPGEGDRYIVGPSASGAWAGRDDELAIFRDGDWDFRAPATGWLAWVAAEATFVVWRGDAWTVIDTDVPDDPRFASLGVNTDADETNRFAVKSNAVLFAPLEAAGGGTGDVRFIIGKEAIADTASLLFQTNWSGRAEIGLAGDDRLRVKVSPDGAFWTDALVADPADGTVHIPAGAHLAALNSGPIAGFRNLVINGNFTINQRGFAGGTLAAGSYGLDRWKAGAAGAEVSVAGGIVTLTSGSLVQVIEAPDLAGETVTVSVEGPSADIVVDLDGVGATIHAGAGRRGATLVVPGGSTGDVTLTLSASGATFRRVQLEVGGYATPFERRPAGTEIALCQRYYIAGLHFASNGYADALGQNAAGWVSVNFPNVMRGIPAIDAAVDFALNIDAALVSTRIVTTVGFILEAPSLTAGRAVYYGTIVADAEL